MYTLEDDQETSSTLRKRGFTHAAAAATDDKVAGEQAQQSACACPAALA